MSFLIRPADKKDLVELFDLAKQFTLLNMPADKKFITSRIDESLRSFAGEAPLLERRYFFVCEDTENGNIAGCSQLIGQKGTPQNPNYSFKVLKKERFSPDLSVGFIHQILRLKIETNGASEVGGLVVDKAYRRRPEKVGKLISLSRFSYVGMNLDQFQDELVAEMAPPLTDEGRSEFWEALGRRFTGMPYQEADAISQSNKEFIRSLFPEEDIYLCLLDPKARLVLGRVGPETQPALHMLEGLGFKYKNEVDPFDGGPHLTVPTKEISVIKNGGWATLVDQSMEPFSQMGIVAKNRPFACCYSAYHIENGQIFLPEKTKTLLSVGSGDRLYFTPTV